MQKHDKKQVCSHAVQQSLLSAMPCHANCTQYQLKQCPINGAGLNTVKAQLGMMQLRYAKSGRTGHIGLLRNAEATVREPDTCQGHVCGMKSMRTKRETSA